MTQTIEAVFDGKVFHPQGQIHLEPDTRVQIIIETENVVEPPSKSFLRTARELNLKAPADFSEAIDEYLYGGKDLDDE